MNKKDHIAENLANIIEIYNLRTYIVYQLMIILFSFIFNPLNIFTYTETYKNTYIGEIL